MSDRLTLQLEAKIDSNQKKYYVAKLKGPVKIDCKDGVAFLIFTSEEGSEELQIANYAPSKSKYKEMPYYKKHEEEHND